MNNTIARFLSIAIILLSQSLSGVSLALAADLKKSLPDDWWKLPSWSPDGKLMAVYSPGPEKTPFIGKDGKTYFGYKFPETEHTKIVRISDYSVVCEIDGVYAQNWSFDGKLLAAISGGCEVPRIISIFDAQTGRCVRKTELRDFASFRWSPVSNEILVIEEKRVFVLDASTGAMQVVATASSRDKWQNGFWSADGKYFGSNEWLRDYKGWTSVVTIWSAADREIIRKITVPNSMIYNASWSPNGDLFAYQESNRLHLTDAVGEKEAKVLTSRDQNFIIYRWSTDGKQLAYKDYDTVRVLSTKSFIEELSIKGSANGFFDFEWSPNDKNFLIRNQDTVAICDAVSGQYLAFCTFPGCSDAFWKPIGDGLVLQIRDSAPKFVSLSASLKGAVFTNGKTGSPGWENNRCPKNLEECFDIFNKELTPQQIQTFKNSTQRQISAYGGGHIITDSMMSDVYSKWGMTALDQYFKKLNVHDPCAVTGIILTSYWRHLNNRPLDIDGQIQFDQAWNDQFRMIVPGNSALPQDVLNTEFSTKSEKNLSIRMLNGKVKLIAFVDIGYPVDCYLLRALKRIITSYPASDVSGILFLVDRKFLGIDDYDYEGAVKTKAEIHALLSDLSSRFQSATVSRKQWTRLSEVTSRHVPQVIILSPDNKVIARLQETGDEEDTKKALEDLVKSALSG